MKYAILFILLGHYYNSNGQQVASIPFKFENGFSNKEIHVAYYAIAQKEENISFILKDNVKISYVLFDKNFKLLKQIDVNTLENSPFYYDTYHYYGAVGYNKKFTYLFKDSNRAESAKLVTVTVDFESGDITNQIIATLEEGETNVITFPKDRTFYAITAFNAEKSMVVRVLGEDGVLREKKISFPLPSFIKTFSMSYYMGKYVIKKEDELEYSGSTHKRKLYVYDDRLLFLTNWGSKSAHVFTINLKDFTTDDRHFPPYGAEIPWSDNAPETNAAILDNKIFQTFIASDKLTLCIHDLITGKLLKILDITNGFPKTNFSIEPEEVKRRPGSIKRTPIKNFEKMFKDMRSGNDALVIRKNPSGYYELTFGYFRYVPFEVGYNGLVYNFAQFKLNLSPVDFEVIQGPSTDVNKIEEAKPFFAAVSDSKLVRSDFFFNNIYYESYFDKKRQEFVIETHK